MERRLFTSFSYPFQRAGFFPAITIKFIFSIISMTASGTTLILLKPRKRFYKLVSEVYLQPCQTSIKPCLFGLIS